MKFETFDILKESVRNYIVYHRRDIKWLKNDKQRCKAICKDEECKPMMQKVCIFYSNDYLFFVFFFTREVSSNYFYTCLWCCHFVPVSVYYHES